MKGFITGIANGILLLAMIPTHPLLGVIASFFIALVILAFWTNAVRVRIERN